MDALSLTEIMLRGASAGLLLLLAMVLMRYARCCMASRFGALFALGTATYATQSSEALHHSEGLTGFVISFFCLQCVTFFWWFANAALDDDFEWRAWHWTPFAAISVLTVFYVFVPPLAAAAHLTAQIIMLAMAIHVLWVALAERRHDLLEQRRTVRLVFVAITGVACIGGVLVELLVGHQLPQWLDTLLALEIFVISLSFSIFLLQPAKPLIPANAAPGSDSTPDISPADVYEMGKLEELMRSGFYTRDSLTISEVGEALEIPEHRLRKLINQQLGFRNFTAYLNSHRLSDAKSMLADPKNARRQITQIAFELGYGSITPFNRAFKADQGMTPTEFRRMALAEDTQRSSSTH
ncbi:MAG: helix-turn-helix domain-containing protein [Gammaproteobacteria bacterium]